MNDDRIEPATGNKGDETAAVFSRGYQPRRLNALLTDSWNLCVSNAWRLVTIVLSVYIPLAILNLHFQSWVGGMVAEDPVFMGENWGPFVAFVLANAVLGVVCTNALYRSISCLARRESIGLGEAYRQGIVLFFPALWLSFLYSLVVAGGIILLVVPGVLFAIWFGLSYPALMVDGARGISALKVSRIVVRPHMGKVVGNYLVIWLIVSCISLLVFVFLSIVSGIVSMKAPWLTGGIGIAKGCLSPLVGIWMNAFLILLYSDLREAESAAVEKVLNAGGFMQGRPGSPHQT